MLVTGRGRAPLVDPGFEGDLAHSAGWSFSGFIVLLNLDEIFRRAVGCVDFSTHAEKAYIYIYTKTPMEPTGATDIVTVNFRRCACAR